MLAAWMRFKYPNLVDGAIAASAPILLVGRAVDRDFFFQDVTKVWFYSKIYLPLSGPTQDTKTLVHCYMYSDRYWLLYICSTFLASRIIFRKLIQMYPLLQIEHSKGVPGFRNYPELPGSTRNELTWAKRPLGGRQKLHRSRSEPEVDKNPLDSLLTCCRARAWQVMDLWRRRAT